MGVLQGIVNVGKAVLRIGKIVVPVLRGLGSMVPEIGKLFQGVDDAIADGGVQADDFFDRNLSTIGDIREFFRDLQVFGAKGEETCDAIVVASQVDTPDMITIAEGEHILALTNDLRETLQNIVTKNESLEAKIDAME